jgi:hypothetical protein
MADLLMLDAEQRQTLDATLWALKEDARDSVLAAVKGSMAAENPPFRQQWLVAEAEGAIVGLTHSILLPVPPIYAGLDGAPGLIMEDCFVAEAAPEGTAQALLAAAEDDLRGAGARVLLTSSVPGGDWCAVCQDQGYAPLTLYLSKNGLADGEMRTGVRKATEDDVPAIVKRSSEHRQILRDLDVFWEPHPEADTRFGNWMKRSLTLMDRDMFVAGENVAVDGYAISQPATPLHFPPAHEISATGVIDDFHHVALQYPTMIGDDEGLAMALFEDATAALRARGNAACLVVCPAAWSSKIALLEKAGFETALIWLIKR